MAENPDFAHRTALTFVYGKYDRSWSYAELWREVQRVGRGLLARGLEPGDRVLIRLPHSPEYAIAFFGATVAGLVPIPASPQLTTGETAFLVADAEAGAVVAAPGLRLPGFGGLEILADEIDRLDGGGPLPETEAEDPAYLIYTSGTTARPRGVLHAHRTLMGRALIVDGWEDLHPSDITMHAGTLNWSYTMGAGLIDPWLVGAHAMLYGGEHDPRLWPLTLERYAVTVFAAVPTVYRQILKYSRPMDFNLSQLRRCLSAGEALPPSVAERWRLQCGSVVYEALGMTEISTYISSGPDTPVRPGSPGRPQPGRRVAILPENGGIEPLPPGEIGLLAVHRSDPGLMLGYWRRPQEEASVFRGDWFVGGDLAMVDDDGYVWFQGRADDVFKSFGYRLSPVEIEAAIEAHPSVAEVAVVGLPVTEDRTLVVAGVVLSNGAAQDEVSLRAHADRHLAAYKRPHQYRFFEALPRTRSGKLQRRALLERLLADG